MAQLRRLVQSGRATRILQQREVVGGDFGKRDARRSSCEEIIPRQRIRRRPVRLALRRMPPRFVSQDDRVEKPLVGKRRRLRGQSPRIRRHDHARIGIGELVDKNPFGIQRAEMDDDQAGLHRTEERDRMIGRVRQIERDPVALAKPKRCEAMGRASGHVAEFAIGDRRGAELDCRLVAPFRGSPLDEGADRPGGERDVGLEAVRICALPGGLGWDHFKPWSPEGRQSPCPRRQVARAAEPARRRPCQSCPASGSADRRCDRAL